MGVEACPECGALTKVYSDRHRSHEDGCSLARHCRKCNQQMTKKNTERYLSPTLCDVCEWHERDDLAWLSGTGRFAQ